MIALVILSPVERSPSGPLTHVREEVLKACPALADRNTATSVNTESVTLRIGAASVHRQPRAVGPSSCSTVRPVEIPYELALFAPATGRSAAAEMRSATYNFSAAVTSAKPMRPPSIGVVESQNEEPLETEAREISSRHHIVQRNMMWAVMQ